MRMKTLITYLIQAVADDTAIAAWSATHFGRGISVKGHHDVREAPIEETACPLVVFRPAEKVADLEGIRHLVRAVIYLWDDDEKTESRTNLDQYEVIDHSDDLCDLIRAAVLAAEKKSFSGCRLVEVATVYDSAEGVPLQQTIMGFKFENTVRFGGNFQ